MNDELKELYQNNWVELLKNAKTLNTNAANPLLIKVDEEYINSEIKVMIVGQETDGWHGELNLANKSVDDLMGGYSDYFYKNSKNGKERGKRAFWNKKNYSYFESELSKYFINKDKTVSFIWNNISKIGNAGRGRPNKEILNLERSCFNILKEEFYILKPDIIIFTTGKRDSYIKHHFGENTEFTPLLYLKNNILLKETLPLIAKVIIPDRKNICSIRVEHPNRRTLHNSIIVNLIKEIWETNEKHNKKIQLTV